jgi:hypothetical protein
MDTGAQLQRPEGLRRFRSLESDVAACSVEPIGSETTHPAGAPLDDEGALNWVAVRERPASSRSPNANSFLPAKEFQGLSLSARHHR